MKTNQFKYKIGDKVKCTGWAKPDTGVIVKLDTNCYMVKSDSAEKPEHSSFKDYDGWCFYQADEELELNPNNNKIVITTDANKTIARLYDGNKVVKTAEAKCNATDTYDFTTGANLAYDRLMGRDVKTVTEPKQDKPQYKAGDKVIIKGAKSGCTGAEGKKGIITGHAHLSGLLSSDDGINVLTDGGNIWRVNIDSIVLEPAPFSWQAFRTEKIAVHCDTEEKAKAFLRECENNGVKWAVNNDGSTRWGYYKGDTCYAVGFETLKYSPIDYYKDNGYTIVEYPFAASAEVVDPLADYEWIDGYKGFDSNLKCKDFQYEVGKEYDLGAEEKMCSTGFHFCKTLEETHQFYSDNGTNRFCKVSGLVKKGFAYSDKYCARKIKICEEVTKPKGWNGKVVCTEAKNGICFTLGKVYTVKDGKITDNTGDARPCTGYRYTSLESLNDDWDSKFILFLGEQS